MIRSSLLPCYLAIAISHCVLVASIYSAPGNRPASVRKGAEKLATTREKEKPKGKEEASKKDKPKSIAEVTKDQKKIEGLFTLFQNTTNGSVHLLIKESQIDKEYVYFTFTADGVVEAGHFRGNFRDNRIFSIRKHFNRIEFVAENTSFYFDKDSPLSRASKANISPAILTSQEIVAKDDEKKEYLIKADPIFLSEALHQVKPSPNPEARGPRFTLGSLSKDKTKFAGLRSYPANTDIIVEYVYENAAPARGGHGSEAVTDARNVSIRMQHTLIEMPQNSYQPRFDDPRVGYFMTRVTDLTSTSATPYRDVIHRWHLEKKDKTAKVSEPVKPITWWIENTTPVEIRPILRDALLAWNESFEAAGFKNAIEVKIQPDDADWDAGDIRYNVLRWTSSPNPPFGGYGPSFVNPRTGEILGADIMLEYIFIASRILNGRLFPTAALNLAEETDETNPMLCGLGHHLQLSSLFGLQTLKTAGATDLEKSELIKDSLYYLILHEVGHTLGLNHNMRSSHFHSNDQVHNREITSKTGLTGSVMDYPAVNLAPPGRKQGQYYTTRPGPYDTWAVQYGYTAYGSGYEPSLQDILDRSTEPALAFGNDADDMRAPGKAIDPRVMIGDMSSDSIAYAIDRVKLVRQTMLKVLDRIPNKGQSYQELLFAYYLLSGEIANAGRVISRFIGGVYVERGMYGQPNASKPFTPVTYDDQKRAMNALREYIFAPNAFDAPGDLYNFLQQQRRGFDFFENTEDPKLHSRVLNIHRDILEHLLHPRVLMRLTDSRLYGNRYSVSEFMNDLTDAVFENDPEGVVNTYRQNLQLELVNRLVSVISEPGKARFDNPSRSSALYQLTRIQGFLKRKEPRDIETKAHTQNVLFTIDNALDPKG